jgi:Cys-tRNA(Pro)/Cys-tRNA(Cys) deacylase
VSGRGTPATLALEQAEIAHWLHEYEHVPVSPELGASYALEAAEALAVDPARIHKTLIVAVERTGTHSGNELVVAVVPANATCDLKALALAAHAKKATMADASAAQRSTGYVLGGISPLGQRRALVTFIDEEAQLWDTIFVSGGHRGFEIELAPADLARVTDGRFAPIARRRAD